MRYPLNDLLGAQAHIRLLRVLANEVSGPLVVSDAARRAGMTVQGAQKALEKLSRLGSVTRVGGGRKHQYEISRSDTIMQAVLTLFQVEKERYTQLLADIKGEIGGLTPPPRAAWIRMLPREAGEALTLGMLHDARDLAEVIRQLRKRLNHVEKRFDITIELEGFAPAEITDLDADGFIQLYGVIPLPDRPTEKDKEGPLTHAERDLRLRFLSHNLADAIERDPSLIRRARDHCDRLLEHDQGAATRDIEEWRDILVGYPVQRLSRFLKSSSQRADRLRQSNPFLAVLNDAERVQLMEP